jgi:hypothetical protein
MLLMACAALALPAVSSGAPPSTITVAPNSPEINGNCFPFGTGITWTPYTAFIYKNIPAFQLKTGDTLAFDTAAVNESAVQLEVSLASTSVNGGDVPGGPFTTVVTNSQTPANPTGNTTPGDYELRFAAQAPFSFPGGGLIIRFSNPSSAYAMDLTCTADLVSASATDSSGFFVKRGYGDADGVDPWSLSDTNSIGAFRLTLLPTSNTFALGKLTRNKNKGTAILPVDVPGPGTLSLTGKGVKPQRPLGAVASTAVPGAGRVNLRIKAKGKKKKKLNKAGKVKVTVNITFTPTGAPAGDPKTEIKTVKLVKRI